MTPKISVVMSVYNGCQYLQEAIDSILGQTFNNFEFIIVDDASTDTSHEIICSFEDPRIVCLKNEKNIGLASSLNKGLKAARSMYIARMDADDVSLPDRLKKQVCFLDAHPEIGILGCACRLIDAKGQVCGVKPRLQDDTSIRWAALLRNPFIHPSVMLRREVLVTHGLFYDETFQQTQDYEFFTRVLKYTKGANVNEPLLLYRTHPGDITSNCRGMQLKNHDLVALRTIREALPGFFITPQKVSNLREVFVDGSPSRVAQKNLAALALFYLDLFRAFAKSRECHELPVFLQQREALRAALPVLRLPLQSGWFTVLRHAYGLHHGLLLDLIRLIPGFLHRRLRLIAGLCLHIGYIVVLTLP